MKSITIKLEDESLEALKKEILNNATDEDLVAELLRRTSGELHEYFDPNLRQKVKRAEGKLVTKRTVVKYVATIKTDI